MVLTKKLIIIAMAASVLAGCTTVKRVTGQIDDSKLPGQREDILPPDQQQARDPAVTGQPLPQDPNAVRVSNGQGAGQMPQQPGMAPQQQGIAPQQPGVAPQPGGFYAAAPPAGTQIVAPQARGAAKGAGQESITDNGAKTAGDCDPKVDLCPQVLRPEPLPPPSPLVPAKVAKAKEAKAAAATGTTTVVKKKKLLKKKLPVEDPVPPEPKDDAPAPSGQVAPPPAPAPQAQ